MTQTLSEVREDNPPSTHYCYEWMTPEDAIKHALAAFYAACRYTDHAQRAFPDDKPHNRTQWTETFTEILRLRVELQLEKTGITIHEKTADYLEGYIEPCWHGSILSLGDTQDNVHCRPIRATGGVGANIAAELVPKAPVVG